MGILNVVTGQIGNNILTDTASSVSELSFILYIPGCLYYS
jgi:hypothetical protein